MEGNDPSVESWKTMTLAGRIERKDASWFSSAEILGFVLAGVALAAVLASFFFARERQPRSPSPTDSGSSLTFKTPVPESTPAPDPRGIFKPVEGNNNPFAPLSQDETILKPAGYPKPSPDQGMSAARQQVFDKEAAAITKKLEDHKASSTGDHRVDKMSRLVNRTCSAISLFDKVAGNSPYSFIILHRSNRLNCISLVRE